MLSKTPRPTPHLILGGAKSGKSLYAERLIAELPPPYVYIATAQPLDDEMKERIRIHRQRREGLWDTIESPIDLTSTLRRLQAGRSPVLVDCLTLWLTNLLLDPACASPEHAVEDLCDFLPGADYPLFLVSNEVGAGIVPENDLARRFRDLAGTANQRVAEASRSVTMVVAGLHLILK